MLAIVSSCSSGTKSSASKTAGPASVMSCGRAVDALSAAYSGNASDAEVGRIAYQSFAACGPNNGGQGAAEWEVAAKYDHIAVGNTDVHDVLAALCHDNDHSRTTNVCQDSIIKDLTDAMDKNG